MNSQQQQVGSKRFRFAGKPRKKKQVTLPPDHTDSGSDDTEQRRLSASRLREQRLRGRDCEVDQTALQTQSPTMDSSSLSDSQSRGRWLFSCFHISHFKDRDNVLAALTLLCELLALPVGFLLRFAQPSPLAILLIGFPGELLINMLKMLMLPLVISSLISGLSALNLKSSGKIAVSTLVYFFCTSWLGVMLGIVLMMVLRPGHKLKREDDLSGKVDAIRDRSNHTLAHERSNQAFVMVLDFFRNLVPDNPVGPLFYKSTTGVSQINQSGDQSSTKWVDGELNMLGVICISIFAGFVLRRMEDKGQLLVAMFCIFTDVIMQMVRLVICQVLQIKDFKAMISNFGPYIAVVSTGLWMHMCLVQALSYLLLTRKNPILFFRGVFQAWVTAIGTSSSAATLPITFRCLEDNIGVDKRITRFVLPIGANLNMNGTALYLAASCLFIAQVNRVDIDSASIIGISFLATLVAMGTAGLPRVGSASVALILTTIGQPANDVALISTVEWLLDLQGTAVNVMGDAYCAGILQHIFRYQTRLPRRRGPLAAAAFSPPAADAEPNRSSAPVNRWLEATVPYNGKVAET